jgi:hypothetical protein
MIIINKNNKCKTGYQVQGCFQIVGVSHPSTTLKPLQEDILCRGLGLGGVAPQKIPPCGIKLYSAQKIPPADSAGVFFFGGGGV